MNIRTHIVPSACLLRALLLLPGAALAAEPGRPFAAPEAAGATAPGTVTGLAEVVFALALVLAAIFAAAWLMRRMRAFGVRADALDVLAEVPLGPKERAVLVRVGKSQLLLGVAPGRVSMLHVLPEPLDVTPAATPDGKRPSFRDLLSRSLGK